MGLQQDLGRREVSATSCLGQEVPMPPRLANPLTGTCWTCEVTVADPGATVVVAVAVSNCWGAAL